jgi:hypothetical protein
VLGLRSGLCGRRALCGYRSLRVIWSEKCLWDVADSGPDKHTYEVADPVGILVASSPAKTLTAWDRRCAVVEGFQIPLTVYGAFVFYGSFADFGDGYFHACSVHRAICRRVPVRTALLLRT